MSAEMPADWTRIELASCASTNDEAARLARAGAAHGTVVVARAQTAGRGREGRAWSSPPDAGLYVSIVLRPSLPLADVPPLTLALGIAACDAAIAAGAPARLKWPNDVLVGTRKLAGVLVETQSQGSRLEAAIAGIGLNLTSHAARPDTAIALDEASGRVIDRSAVLASLLDHLARWIDRYVALGLDAIIPAWHDRMATGLAARATIDGIIVDGTVAGLDRDGALLLRDPRGDLHRIRSGDVQVLR